LYNLSDYVLLEAVCEALGDAVNIKIPKSKTMEINNGVYVPLEDCYQALDQILSGETKQDIKESETLVEYHFGLGIWMRNNWIYPTDGRIAKTLRDAGINDPDDMSSEILRGYQRYLRGSR